MEERRMCGFSDHGKTTDFCSILPFLAIWSSIFAGKENPKKETDKHVISGLMWIPETKIKQKNNYGAGA